MGAGLVGYSITAGYSLLSGEDIATYYIPYWGVLFILGIFFFAGISFTVNTFNRNVKGINHLTLLVSFFNFLSLLCGMIGFGIFASAKEAGQETNFIIPGITFQEVSPSIEDKILLGLCAFVFAVFTLVYIRRIYLDYIVITKEKDKKK